MLSQNDMMISSVFEVLALQKLLLSENNHKKIICILIIVILCAIRPAGANDNVNILANVCYPGTFTNEFAFAKPVVCVDNPPGNIVKCEASISQPRAEEVEINAYACFKTIEGWKSYVSFFGGREKTELEPIQCAITFDE